MLHEGEGLAIHSNHLTDKRRALYVALLDVTVGILVGPLGGWPALMPYHSWHPECRVLFLEGPPTSLPLLLSEREWDILPPSGSNIVE